MGASGNCLMTYVTILDCCEDGTVWLQVHMPTGRLARGPYLATEEARAAAAAVERVARRRWAQHAREARETGGEIGTPVPLPSGTAGQGQGSAKGPPIRPEFSRIHRVLPHFLPTST
jgi:hypothetical protein